MTEQTQRAESILAADCGSTMTRVALLDRVDGRYRFVARGEVPSTVRPPWEDVSLGLHHALVEVERATGRKLFDERGELIIPERADGAGVDALVSTVSVAEPLRVVVIGLARSLSLSSALRAVRSTYVRVMAALSQDREPGTPAPEGEVEEERLNLLLTARPDVVVLVGGTDGGATVPVLDNARVVGLACSLLPPEERPVVVYAGNAQLRKAVVELLGEGVDLRMADNVAPAPGVEALGPVRSVLETLYQERFLGATPGGDVLASWSAAPILPTARAMGHVVRYLARAYGARKGVLAVDVGGATVSLVVSAGAQFGVTVHSEVGLSYGLQRAMELVPIEQVVRWLPFEISPAEVQRRLLNKALHPQILPQTREDVLIEQAMARELIRLALAEAREGWGIPSPYPDLMPYLEPIVATGGVLCHAPFPGQAALVLLDALEPIGVTTLVLDTNGLAAPLGAVGQVEPLASVEVLGYDGFTHLATVIAPVVRARRGERVVSLEVGYEEGGKHTVEVEYGSLEVIPLTPGRRATVRVRPLRGADVGWGPGREGALRIRGGLVGLIVDARGRPIELPEDAEARQMAIQRWLWDVGA